MAKDCSFFFFFASALEYAFPPYKLQAMKQFVRIESPRTGPEPLKEEREREREENKVVKEKKSKTNLHFS